MKNDHEDRNNLRQEDDITVSSCAPEEGNQLEVLFAVEGRRQHFGVPIGREMTVREFAIIATKAGGLEEAVEIFLEDAEEPLNEELVLAENLAASFSPLHVATHGKIAVTVHYNGRDIHREFRPSATVARVIRWAISPEGFNLEGDPSDFELKHDGEVAPPDMHLGQIAHGHKRLKFELVFKVKPQG